MPKLKRVPRVSIVIPFQRDEKRFEATLLSVLENRPADCEILAVHNGTYSDPFELADELTFVTARSSNLVDLVRDAFAATTAPIVNVLGTGMEATPDYLVDALDRFADREVAAVCPTLITASGEVLGGAGWSDVAGRYCQPDVSLRGRATGVVRSGFFLNAFLVRRRLLGNLLDAVAPAMNDPVAVSYAFGCLLAAAGWKVETSLRCRLGADDALQLDDDSDLARGECLGAIRARVLPDVPTPPLRDMLGSAVLGPSSVGEMIGMLRHRRGLSAIRRAIDPETVARVEQASRVFDLEMHDRQIRRAA